MCGQILVKLPNVKFRENLFSGSRQTDVAKRTRASLQLLLAYASI
jgi:hypothetical protein